MIIIIVIVLIMILMKIIVIMKMRITELARTVMLETDNDNNYDVITQHRNAIVLRKRGR